LTASKNKRKQVLRPVLPYTPKSERVS
jgi:hypothetical protein